MNPVEAHIVFRANDEIISLMDRSQRLELLPDDSPAEESGRLFTVRIGEYESKALLLDLPTVTESQKTLDGINFFKVADICPPEEGKSLSRMLDSESRYGLKSGLTPAACSITSQFFKREVSENIERVKAVEKQIKRAMEQKGSRNVRTQVLEFSDEEAVPKDSEQVFPLEEDALRQ